MRKNVLSAALAFGLLALVTTATAYAQVPGTALHATIPFDFRVRGKILPAGDYEISRITEQPDGLIISSLNDKHKRVVFETEAVEARRISSRSEIVFQRYGNTYFLSEIFSGTEQTGRELPPSRQELRLKREMASNKTEPETVALAAY